MLKTKRMKKVRVIALRSSAESLIKSLHEAGVMQIDESKLGGLEAGKPLRSFDEASSLLLKLRSSLSIMEASVGKKSHADGETKEISAQVAIEEAKRMDLEERLRTLAAESASCTERIREIEAKIAPLKKALVFSNVDFTRLSTRKLTYRLGETNNIAPLRQKLAGLKDIEVISKLSSPVVLILFDRKHEASVDSVLSESGFSTIELAPETTTPADTISRLTREMEALNPKIDQLRKEIRAISEKNISHVRSLIKAIEVEAERGEIASRFSTTKSMFVFEGWALDGDFQSLREICERYGGKVQLEEMHVGHHEKPPVVLDNPKQAAPFEFLTRSYSLPNYFEIDPTMVYLIALPILYGMIVGDVIYGLISFAVAFLIFKKFEKSETMRNVSMIWMYSALPTILLGIFYDEWCGMSLFHLTEVIGKWTGIHLLASAPYTGFHRIENVMGLIAITCLVGMAHLALGFIFGAINEWEHNKKHSIAKIAWLGVEVGGLLLILALTGMLDKDFMNAGLAVLGLSVVILALTEGLLGIIELPGLAGNILSYSRIATIGIVGVVIAEMINELLMPLPDKGLLVLVLIPIFIILHISNAFLAMFEAIIQGGRLNIVEFKSKFLHGGGKEYIPFALRKR